ncbi:MAG: aminopeptidase P family protein, partial [Planctomycetia bacterium]|nr:aminopeptidase P family protein [Planctomycetia bacterium]
MNPYPLRRERLARLVAEEQLDALLVSNPVNVSYLTGFSGDSTYLLLGQQSRLISDGRYTAQLAEECPDLDTYIRPSSELLPAAVAKVLTQSGLHAIGFESSSLSVAEFEGYREHAKTIDWKSGRNRVEQLRAVKDAGEVAEIREAIAFAEKAFAMFQAMLRPQDTEKELHDAMEMYIRRAGGRCSSFPAIIAAGPRAALAHAPPTAARAGDHALLLVDWGASGRFYKSDLTRVLIPRNHSAFSRPPAAPRETTADGKLEQVYETVLRAQQQAIRAIRPGVTGHDVDAAARQVIADAGYGDFFIHSLGHGLGMQVHEGPSLRANIRDVLQAGNV